MKISELPNPPKWLTDARTMGADVRYRVPDGAVVWDGGAFLGGAFRGGEFLGGAFLGGTFLGGAFRGGEFLGGAFWGGAFRGGAFRGGEFLGGAFLGGEFLGGRWAATPRLVIDLGSSRVGNPRSLQYLSGTVRYRAGCHLFTLAEARVYWGNPSHPDRERADENLRVIDFAEGEARRLGWPLVAATSA